MYRVCDERRSELQSRGRDPELQARGRDRFATKQAAEYSSLYEEVGVEKGELHSRILSASAKQVHRLASHDL